MNPRTLKPAGGKTKYKAIEAYVNESVTASRISHFAPVKSVRITSCPTVTLACRFTSYAMIKINKLGICIAPTQPFRAALGAEQSVLPGQHSRQANSMIRALKHQVNSKSNSQPPLEFEPFFGMLAHFTSLTTRPSLTQIIVGVIYFNPFADFNFRFFIVLFGLHT
jgi:hypothetical protein